MKEFIFKYIKHPTTQRIILLGVVILLILFWKSDIDSYKRKLATTKQNILALNSELKTWKSKANTYLTERYILIGEIDSLKKYSMDLYLAIERIKKEGGGDVATGTEIDITVDGLQGTSTETRNVFDKETNKGSFIWDFQKNEDGFSRTLTGRTDYFVTSNEHNNFYIVPEKTFIDKDEYKIEVFTYTILNKDKSLSVIAETKNKNVKIEQLKSVIMPETITKINDIYIEPAKYSFDIGVHGGFGINPNGNLIQPIPYVGVGIGFNFKNLIRF